MFGITEKHFSFLLDLGFKGPFEYNYVREIHSDYVKKDIIIQIIYEGSFSVNIIKTKRIFPDLENGTKKVIELGYDEITWFDLMDLSSERIKRYSVDYKETSEQQMLYYSKLLRNNPDILKGDLTKFKSVNIFLRKLGLRK